MADLAPQNFAEFFQAVHHPNEPFKWQKRLAAEVLQEGADWPDLIRVPTACGKTSVLDLAIFQLALQAESAPAQRTAGRRICFVVDRRLVIDEVTEHALRIRSALVAAANGSRTEPVLKAVASRLKELAADPAAILRVVRLRGGVYRDDGWAADPLTPTILVSTVDQIGSRLLFRGYGVGPRSSSVHAGLLAFDTRIILDEAHLSGVFAKTVQRIRKYQRLAERCPVDHTRGVSLVRMSATVGEEGKGFELSAGERDDIRLSPRLNAQKLAELDEVKVEAVTATLRKQQASKAREQEIKNREALAARLIEHAERLCSECKTPPIIGVVVNSVAMARRVFERLRNPNGDRPDRDAILLTGRIRPYDRDRLLNEWLPRIKVGRQNEAERPIFVVGTQTIEVGANLDFNALVTEAASLDSLRQRFGRLDRLGERHIRNLSSPAVIVIRSDRSKNSELDRIYGSSIAASWKWLSSKDVRGKAKQVDFGVNRLDARLQDVNVTDLGKMLAPQPDPPLLFPAHLDAWAQTNPKPTPDPDVAPFLHGAASGPADVQIIWRADLTEQNEPLWKGIVGLMPPRTREAMPVPLFEVQRWLRGEAPGEIADIEGSDAEQDAHQRAPQRSGVVLRWRGSGDPRTSVVGPGEIRPADTIIVPSSYGGSDELGWNPSMRTPVADVAEDSLAQLIASYPTDAFRRPALRIRLHPRLFAAQDTMVRNQFQKLLNALVASTELDANDKRTPLVNALGMLRKAASEPARSSAIDAFVEMMDSKRLPRIEHYPDDSGVVLSAFLMVLLPGEQAMSQSEFEDDELVDDELSIAPGGHAVTLSQHTLAVQRKVVEFAEECGLNQFSETLRIAACWHDEGKRDPRFQAWLHGSEIAALAADEPLAKSGRDSSEWGVSDAFAYPRGARHEFVSVRFFEKAEQRSIPNSDLDLAKLLIGTHHGNGRAFATIVNEPNPVMVARSVENRTLAVCSDHRLYRLDSNWTDLFWGMIRRYGWWGLSYLEAILITADRLVSAQEQASGREAGDSG